MLTRLVLLLTLLLAPSAFGQTSADADALMGRFADAWSRDDTGAIASMLADDIVFFDANRSISGRAAFADYLRTQMAGTDRMMITPIRSGVGGDVAYHAGRWTLSHDGGLSEGVHTFIFHRNAAGDWKITSAHVEDADADGAARGGDPVGAAIRGGEGEPVAIWVNHVKPEKRAQFEAFLEAFWAAGDAAIAEGQMTGQQAEAYRNVRVLLPEAASEDGTYTYIFLADPFVPGADYEILNLLRLRHSESEAARINRLYEEALAGPQGAIRVRQSRY